MPPNTPDLVYLEVVTGTATEWSERGYRLYIGRFPGILHLTVQARTVSSTGDQYPLFLCQISVWLQQPMVDALLWVEHCLGYFNDDTLKSVAQDAVRASYETAHVPGAPVPGTEEEKKFN